jgi:WD40 repeat protein
VGQAQQASTACPETQTDLTGQSEPRYFRSVARLGVQVAEALEYAHRQGILHRDIKPSNLLLDTAGQVWVSDFGLAKAEDSEELTNPGDVVGTLCYLAPERLRGKGDTRSDVYGLGITLYELLTLRAAFAESDRALLMERIRRTEPPRLRKLDRRIPNDLETIVLKAIAKDPADRYATAEALAEDLRRFLADRPIQARRTPVLERSWRWCRRNPTAAALVCAVLLLLVALAGGSLLVSFWAIASERAENEIRARRVESFFGQLAKARASRFSRRPGQRFPGLEALSEAAQIARDLNMPDDRFLELRHEVIACLALPDLRPSKSLDAWLPGTTILVFSDSYELYARGDQQGNISVRRVADNQEITRVPGSGQRVEGLQFSPNERFLAWWAGRLLVWQLDQGKAILAEDSADSCWSFSPDSHRMAIGRQDGTITLCDLPAGTETKRLRAGVVANALAFRRDGSQLAVCYHNRALTVQIWDTDSGSLVAALPVGTAVVSMAWHPDGNRLALGLARARAEIWDVTAQRRVANIEGHVQDVVKVSFHPCGDLLVTQSWDGTTRLWNTWTGRQLLDWPAVIDEPRFSRDGSLLGYVRNGSQVQFLEMASGSEHRTFVSSLGAGQGVFNYGDISPDGRLLATGMDDGVRLWELDSGRELAFLPVPPTWSNWSVFFQPDGSELLSCGESGLLRWPIHQRSSDRTAVRIGPPRTVALPVTPHFAFASPDGRTLAVSSEYSSRGLILDLSTERVLATLGPSPGMSALVLSPDKKWAATFGWYAPTVKVWDTRTRQLEKELPPSGARTCAYFTPDSKSLVTCTGDEYCFWDVATWQPARRLARELSSYPGALAFSRDGAVMALELSPGIIDLQEFRTGRTLAKLEDPNRDRVGWLCFTPDGSQLVNIATYSKVVHVWDLRAIRHQLAAMGLDWDLPQYPAPAKREEAKTRKVEVDLGDLYARQKYSLILAFFPLHAEAYYQRGLAYARFGQWPAAFEDLNKAMALKPDQAKACDLRAAADFGKLFDLQMPADPFPWFLQAYLRLQVGDVQGYRQLCARMLERFRQGGNPNEIAMLAHTCVLGPHALEDEAQVLELAWQRLKLNPPPSNHQFWSEHVMALAYYRAGQYDEAIAYLGQWLEANPHWGPNVLNWLVLALAHAELGHDAEAQKWRDQADDYIRKTSRQQGEKKGRFTPPGWRWQDWLGVQLLRAESEASLKGKKKKNQPPRSQSLRQTSSVVYRGSGTQEEGLLKRLILLLAYRVEATQAQKKNTGASSPQVEKFIEQRAALALRSGKLPASVSRPSVSRPSRLCERRPPQVLTPRFAVEPRQWQAPSPGAVSAKSVASKAAETASPRWRFLPTAGWLFRAAEILTETIRPFGSGT